MSQKRNRGVRATKEGIEILQERRHSLGWTLQALANRTDVSLDVLKRLIRRAENVDRESVRKIVYPLNLQPTDLIDPNEWEGLSSEPPLQSLKTSIAKICISDRKTNSAFNSAQKLSRALQAIGYTVFIAEEAMRQRANWFQRFAEELEQCDCYVLLLSQQSAASEMVIEEVHYVWELYQTQHKPKILPIYVEATISLDANLSQYLAEFQSYTWLSTTETEAIVNAVLNLLHHPENPLTQENLSPPIAPVEYPTGQVRLTSIFYVERPPIEAQCYQEILDSGALIRIKAPRQMGKTSLMARILNQAREHHFHTVCLSFQLASSIVLSDLDRLMQWICVSVSQRLRLPNQIANHWDSIFDGSYNSTTYFEEHILAELSQPLVIGFDEVDRIFAYPEVANDFFGLLRAWYEKAKYGDLDSRTWEKLRFVIVHSTEVYIPMNLNQSPFNVGLSVELPEFTLEQVQALAQRYQLNWTLAQLKQLMDLVGGHPYLVRIAMYHVAHESISLEQLLNQATTESGCYSDHLRRHLWNLEQHPELEVAFREVLAAPDPVQLKSVLAFKLYSMGLVKLENNRASPRCQLYLRYFRDR